MGLKWRYWIRGLWLNDVMADVTGSGSSGAHEVVGGGDVGGCELQYWRTGMMQVGTREAKNNGRKAGRREGKEWKKS